MALAYATFSEIITFTRASTGTYVDSSGTLQTAATDTPRFDHDPVTLAPLGFLIEEARTNVLRYSEQYDDAAWTKNNSTVTPDVVTSPDGNVSADQLSCVATGSSYIVETISSLSNTQYTYTVYCKGVGMGASRGIALRVRNAAATSDIRCNFRLDTNVAGVPSILGTDFTTGASSLTQMANGWYRAVITFTPTVTLTNPRAEVWYGVYGTSSPTDGTVYIWGSQLEAGAFPTSYIPTTSAAVTRAVDVATVNILSPWYNTTESTLYTQFTSPVPTTVSASAAVVGFDDGTSSNRYANFYTSNTGTVASNQVIAGVTSFTINGATGRTLTNTQKVATASAAGSYAISANGNTAVSDSFASPPPSVTTMRIGLRPSGTQANLHLQRVLYYPRRLTNTEIQALTT